MFIKLYVSEGSTPSEKQFLQKENFKLTHYRRLGLEVNNTSSN